MNKIKVYKCPNCDFKLEEETFLKMLNLECYGKHGALPIYLKPYCGYCKLPMVLRTIKRKEINNE